MLVDAMSRVQSEFDCQLRIARSHFRGAHGAAFARADPIGNDDGVAVLCTTTNGVTHAPLSSIGEALLRPSRS